ncbi:MAG: synthase, epsilon subunit [Actinomycetia bacterium]|nr:synthase, epsilon subunit [Actinomycetes bacterium]
MTLHVELVSPEKVLFQGEADMVVCRPSDGDIAFLPGHTPYLGALGIGVLRVLLPDSGELEFAVHGGFVEVANDRVLVLSDVAEVPDQIDVARARSAKERAEAAISGGDESDETKEALQRANTRLAVAGVNA